jgi:hypothetical protein
MPSSIVWKTWTFAPESSKTAAPAAPKSRVPLSDICSPKLRFE